MTNNEIMRAFHEKLPVMMIHYPLASGRCDIEYECISAVTLRRGRNGKEFFEVELKDKKANAVTVTRPECVYLKGDEAPQKPVGSNGVLRHKYGEYKNVLLSNEELDRLRTKLPDTYEKLIEDLSAYMATSGKRYKNHCIVIETWARREAEKKKDNPSTATGQRSKFNNYDDSNKPDYSNFSEQILKEMLGE
jgi:hypothetical protein